MRKSCSVKEPKVFGPGDIETAVHELKKGGQEYLTQEQVLVDSKLNESNINKTLNVSFHTSNHEKYHRTSPRLAKTFKKNSKWIENSFKTFNKEDEKVNEESNVIKGTKRKIKPLGSKNKISPKLQKLASSNNNSSTECSSNSFRSDSSCTGSSSSIILNKKRGSPSVKEADLPKKIKMESPNNITDHDTDNSNINGTSNNVNNNCSSNDTDNSNINNIEGELQLNEENMLKIEVENKRKNVQFKIRDIKSIVAECEWRNRKWKETFLKHKCPTRWGIPTVKNCTEKWDGKQIPQKLLIRYQKYLLTKNLSHPIFLPVNVQGNYDLNKSITEEHSNLSCGPSNEFMTEAENSFKEMNRALEAFNEDETTDSKNCTADGSKMVLRSRNQYKPVMIEDDEGSSDDSDDWMNKQKPGKKSKSFSKNKKVMLSNNQQLVLKLGRCNINKKNGNNGTKHEDNIMGNNSIKQSEIKTKITPDSETVACPICSIRFAKQLIESHATECASKTYKD